MSAPRSERVYALLLRAYPAGFRTRYGREMTIAFRDLARGTGRSRLGFWWEIVTDVARSAPALRIEALQARLPHTSFGGRIMRTLGLLAMVVGILETTNVAVELAGGGVSGRGSLGVLGVFLAVLGGMMLVASGFALRTARGPSARAAAFASLGLFILARALTPWMSIAARTIGLVLPLVLLAVVWVKRDGRTASA